MSLAYAAQASAALEQLGLSVALLHLDQVSQQAAAESWSYSHFLGYLLDGELQERRRKTVALNLQFAGFPVLKRLAEFDFAAQPSLDQRLIDELATGRFLSEGRNVIFLGPPGVGKTHLATALGHIAVRRRLSVHMARAGHLFKRLKAARLDNSTEAEMRRLTRVDLLILDDFALQAMDQTETADFYELIVERHHKTPTIITSNRDPSE